jgi:hypothetical protein
MLTASESDICQECAKESQTESDRDTPAGFGTTPAGHRNTTGTPPGTHWDTTGKPQGHHRDTAGTPVLYPTRIDI